MKRLVIFLILFMPLMLFSTVSLNRKTWTTHSGMKMTRKTSEIIALAYKPKHSDLIDKWFSTFVKSPYTLLDISETTTEVLEGQHIVIFGTIARLMTEQMLSDSSTAVASLTILSHPSRLETKQGHEPFREEAKEKLSQLNLRLAPKDPPRSFTEEEIKEMKAPDSSMIVLTKQGRKIEIRDEYHKPPAGIDAVITFSELKIAKQAAELLGIEAIEIRKDT